MLILFILFYYTERAYAMLHGMLRQMLSLYSQLRFPKVLAYLEKNELVIQARRKSTGYAIQNLMLTRKLIMQVEIKNFSIQPMYRPEHITALTWVDCGVLTVAAGNQLRCYLKWLTDEDTASKGTFLVSHVCYILMY